jgi:hypothetical protein
MAQTCLPLGGILVHTQAVPDAPRAPGRPARRPGAAQDRESLRCDFSCAS